MKRVVAFRTRMAAAETGGGAVAAATVAVEGAKVESLESVTGAARVGEVPKFEDARWVGGTWDLTQFSKDGEIDWDAVIDAGEMVHLFIFFFFGIFSIGVELHFVGRRICALTMYSSLIYIVMLLSVIWMDSSDSSNLLQFCSTKPFTPWCNCLPQ